MLNAPKTFHFKMDVLNASHAAIEKLWHFLKNRKLQRPAEIIRAIAGLQLLLSVAKFLRAFQNG